MKLVRRADDGIEIHIPPGLHWPLAAILTIPGILALLTAIKTAILEGWNVQTAGIIAICLCAIVAGDIFFIRSSGITIGLQPEQGATIDRTWCITRSREELPWDEIGSVELQQDKDSEDSPVFKPVLVLRSGRRLPLMANWSHDKQSCETVTTEIQSLLSQHN